MFNNFVALYLANIFRKFLYNVFAVNDATDPATGITAISDSIPSNVLPRPKYIIALIKSTKSPITGINPTQSRNVCKRSISSK